MAKFKYNGRNITVTATDYLSNGALALVATYDDGEEDILSVNLRQGAPEGSCFIDVNNISWAERFIKKTGIGEYSGIRAQSGFVSYPLYKINLEKL